MDAPVFVTLNEDGTVKQGYALLYWATHPKSNKSYFIPQGEGSVGQIFTYGVKVDADLLPLGVNQRIGLLTDAKELVEITRTDGKRGEKRLATPSFTHGAETFHVSPGQCSLSQQEDGTLNLRLNVVRGEAGTFGGGNKKAPLQVEKVAV